MEKVESLLEYLTVLPPEILILLAPLAIVGYALYILHDVIRRGDRR